MREASTSENHVPFQRGRELSGETRHSSVIFEPPSGEDGTSRLVKRADGGEAHDEPSAHIGRVIRLPDRGLSEGDDESIVRILRAGDPRAPRVVWQRFAPMVHRVLKRAFGPEHDIDDLVQEVFLVLFDRVATLREPKALPAFILSIVAHAIRRELRRKAAARWLHFGDAPHARAREADLDSREALARLYRILDRLAAGDRTAFALRYFEGLELVEVAEAMGVSLATTKRHLAHAHGRILSHARRDAALVEYVSSLAPEATP
jgi:RNA polymerase sigma-70 factor (ECF subfamily)